MSIFDKQETFEAIRKRMAEIKATEEAWFATAPPEEQPAPALPVKPADLPNLEDENWNDFYGDIE